MFKFRINIRHAVCGLYVFLILYMPLFLRELTTIYSITAADYVSRYPWLFYTFSSLEIPCLLFVIFLKKRYRYVVDIRPLIIFVLIKEVVFSILGKDTIFSYGDYSLLLGFLVGAGCYYLLVNTCNFIEEDLLDAIIILNFAFQTIFIVTGRVMVDGRYATLGSSVGEIGIFCSQFLLYYLFCRKKERLSALTIISCIGSLILSASRTNILLSFLFITLFMFNLKKGMKNNVQKQRTVGILACFAIMIVPFLGIFINFSKSGFSSLIQRTLGALQSFVLADASYFSADSSFLDRFLSFSAGFGILSSNPFGIAASAIDLQVKTIENGYFYFPHSTLLVYYLLWSIAALVVFLLFIRLLVESIKQRSNLLILVLYILVSFIFYGAPIINCKTYFWFLCIISLCKRELGVDRITAYNVIPIVFSR